MKYLKILLPILLLIFSISIPYVPQARAGGKGPAAPQLSVSPTTQGAFVPFTLFNSSVVVTLISPFNGWDVEVAVDQGALNPLHLSTTGNLFTTTFGLIVTEIVNCVNGGAGIPINQPGDTGCTSSDGPGIAHSVGLISGPPPSTKPMSGQLFHIQYAAGYGTSSVVHIRNDIISNGSGTGVAHTVGDGQYGAPLDFAVSSSVPTIPLSGLPGGSSGTTNITVTSLLGFSGLVSLSTSITPSIANPVMASLGSSSLTVPAGGSVQTTLTLSTTGSTLNGTYTVTVTGKNGFVTRSASVTALVTASPDLTIVANPTIVAITQGTSQTSMVTLHSINGFAGSVTPSVTVAPKGPTAKLSPSTITLTAGGTASATLTITVGTSLANGTYTATVSIPVSRTVIRSVAITLNEAGDFTISASPPRLSIVAGLSDMSMITITSINGYAGTVTLATSGLARGGPTATLGGTSFTIAKGASATTTLTVSTAVGTSGNLTVVVTGTSSPLKHSQPIGLTIVATGDFIVHANPARLTFSATGSQTSTINIDRFGFSGSLNLMATVSGGPSGTCPGSNCPLATIPSPVTLNSANPDITPLLTVATTSSTPAGLYTVSVTAAATGGTPSHSVTVSLTLESDFTITSSETSHSFTQGTAGSTTPTITVTNTGAFPTTVSLSVTVSPSVTNGPMGVLSTMSLSLAPGGSATPTLTITTSAATPSNIFTVAAKGTEPAQVFIHSAADIVTVEPFSITAVPSSFTFTFGTAGSGSSTITVTSISYTGTVFLSISFPSVTGLSSSITTGTPSANCTPTSTSTCVDVTSGSSATATVSVSTSTLTPRGAYTVTVTGTDFSGLFVVSPTITVNVV